MNVSPLSTPDHLSQKVALVTGGGRGIGKAISLKLAELGFAVTLTYRSNEEAAEMTVAEIVKKGGTAIARQADVADPASVKTLFFLLNRDFGRLDTLVNNAGVSEYLSLEKADTEHFDRIFKTNVRGSLLCARAALPLLEGAQGGTVINISSSLTLSPTSEASVYAMSKAAVECMTRFLAVELGSRNIRVNCVAPGLTETEMLHSVLSKEAQAALIERTPLGRIGTVEEIADVVAFLASEGAKWITGQVIVANGGLR